MALNAVVLPAPFGPMTLVIVPGRTANETPPSALTPPNLTARSLTARPPACSIISPLASPVERPRLAPRRSFHRSPRPSNGLGSHHVDHFTARLARRTASARTTTAGT